MYIEGVTRRPLSGVWVVAVVATLLGAGLPARADEAQAAKRFREGTGLYARGKNREAAEAFEAAFKEDPKGVSMYNAGTAWEAADFPGRAIEAYEKAIAAGVDAAQAKDAASRLAALRKKLEPVPVPPEPVKPEPAKPEPAKPEPPQDPAAARLVRKGGWITIGVSAVPAGLAIALGAVGLSTRSSFIATMDTDQGLHDKAIALRTAANVMWVVAGVGAATGVTLVLAGWASEPSKKATTVEIRTAPAWIGVGGRF